MRVKHITQLVFFAIGVDSFTPTTLRRGTKLFSSMNAEPSVKSLLDGEQEQVIVNRAKREEEILNRSPAPRDELIMATNEELVEAKKWIKKVIKDESRLQGGLSNGSGGFGGGGMANKKKGGKRNGGKASKTNAQKDESVSYNKFNSDVDGSGHGAIIQRHGIARINSVLMTNTAEVLKNYVDEEKIRSEDEIARGEVRPLSRFTRVLLKSNRCDLLLPFDTKNDSIMQALYELLGDGTKSNPGTVGSVIESTLSSDAELYEFACLFSDPGSDRQVIHPDVKHQGDAQKRTGPILTCFVALQDVDEAMGPTDFLPGSNTAESHMQLNNFDLRDDMLQKVPTKVSLLKEGDCSIFDGTTLHAGTANKSDKRRRLFYFTFRSVAMEDPRTSNNPGSIRPELLEMKLSLKQIRGEIARWIDSK
jgi:hypothetical protein